MENHAAAGFVNSSEAIDITRGIKDAKEQELMRNASAIKEDGQQKQFA